MKAIFSKKKIKQPPRRFFRDGSDNLDILEGDAGQIDNSDLLVGLTLQFRVRSVIGYSFS